MKQDPVAADQAEKGSKANAAVTAFDPVSAALQQLHQSVASEELPADFMRLLDEIDAKIAAVTPCVAESGEAG